MTTSAGIAHCISRLQDCGTLAELKTRWDCFARVYQHDATVAKFKDKMKARLK